MKIGKKLTNKKENFMGIRSPPKSGKVELREPAKLNCLAQESSSWEKGNDSSRGKKERFLKVNFLNMATIAKY